MNSVVYYPHLTPPMRWMKLAALCWDQVYTLGTLYPVKREDDVVEFDQRLGGLLRQVDTATVGSQPEVKASFELWLDTEEARRSLGTLQPASTVYRARDVFPMDHLKWPRDSKVFEVPQMLARRHLLTGGSAGKRPGTEILLPRNVALHYLSLCAARAAVDNNADLCAQEEMFAESAVSFRKKLDAGIKVNVLEAFIPDAVDDLEINKIVDLRMDLSSQRLRFSAAVQAVIEEFARISSPTEYPNIQAQIEEIAIQRIDETKKAYKRAKVAAVTQALGMTLIPAPLASLHSLVNVGIFAPAAILSAVALGLSSFYSQIGKATDERRSSAWSYVFQLQDFLK